MRPKVTRRRLIVAAAGTALAAGRAEAQSAPAQSPPVQTDLAKAARELNQRSGEALAKFEIPLSTEPAFQFKV